LHKVVNTRRYASNYKNTIDKYCIIVEDIKYNLHGFDRFNYRRRPKKSEASILKNFI
jgi:hypothetical protein